MSASCVLYCPLLNGISSHHLSYLFLITRMRRKKLSFRNPENVRLWMKAWSCRGDAGLSCLEDRSEVEAVTWNGDVFSQFLSSWRKEFGQDSVQAKDSDKLISKETTLRDMEQADPREDISFSLCCLRVFISGSETVSPFSLQDPFFLLACPRSFPVICLRISLKRSKTITVRSWKQDAYFDKWDVSLASVFLFLTYLFDKSEQLQGTSWGAGSLLLLLTSIFLSALSKPSSDTCELVVARPHILHFSQKRHEYAPAVL